MVKFAEAEKRRGGEGGDRRLNTMMMLERPKMNRAMWESVKTHIMRERRRKKEEQEADEEEERLRKERENKKKQHAMTLGETREQIAKKERELADLKNQKTDLFTQLKKLLAEGKRKEIANQEREFAEKEEVMTVHPYSHGSRSLQIIYPLMGSGRPNNLTAAAPYKLSQNQPQQLVPQGPVKRARSPSPQPPPSNGPSYQTLPYPFKNIGGSITSVVPVTLSTTKVASSSSVYLGGGGSQYYHSSAPPSHVPTSQYSSTVSSQPPPSGVAPATAYLTAGSTHLPSAAAPSHPVGASAIDDKHLSSAYLPHTSRGRFKGHMATLHQVDHKGKPTPAGTVTSAFPPPSAESDKFYARPHHSLHGVLSVQQPAPGGKTGSITSGFPVRSAASSQAAVSTTAHTYGTHSTTYHRNYYGHSN